MVQIGYPVCHCSMSYTISMLDLHSIANLLKVTNQKIKLPTGTKPNSFNGHTFKHTGDSFAELFSAVVCPSAERGQIRVLSFRHHCHNYSSLLCHDNETYLVSLFQAPVRKHVFSKHDNREKYKDNALYFVDVSICTGTRTVRILDSQETDCFKPRAARL